MINWERWEDGYGEERRGLRRNWGWFVKVIWDALSANFDVYGERRGGGESGEVDENFEAAWCAAAGENELCLCW
jgi:hypothetical protein